MRIRRTFLFPHEFNTPLLAAGWFIDWIGSCVFAGRMWIKVAIT